MRLFRKEIFWIFYCLFLWGGIVNVVVADTQRVIDYNYDGAGNITSVRSNLNLSPPDITSLNPAFVNINGLSLVTATGTDLLRTQVTSSDPNLTISNVVASSTSVSFIVRASSEAIIGPASLTFSTRLGSDNAPFLIVEKTPVVTSNPDPIVTEADNQLVAVALLFEEPFSTDQIYDVLIDDPDIASLAEQSITLLAGEREVTLNITGKMVGSTILQINQLSNFLGLNLPVYVLDPYQLPVGNQFIASQPLGVNVQRFNVSPGDNAALSLPLGVTRSSYNIPEGENIPTSPILGVNVGTTAYGINPNELLVDASYTLTVNGVGLDSVTTVEVIPADGVTQNTPFSVNIDGSALEINIDVAANATAGLRQIILTTANGEVVFSGAGGNLILIQ